MSSHEVPEAFGKGLGCIFALFAMEYSLLPSQAPHLAPEEKLLEDKESDSRVWRPNQMRAAKSFEGFRFPRRAPTPSHFNYQRFIKLHLELPGNPRAGGAEMFPEEQPGGPGGAGTEINPGTFPKFRAGWDVVVGFFLAPLKSLHQSRGFPGSQQKAPGLHCCVIPKRKKKRDTVGKEDFQSISILRINISASSRLFPPIFLQG